jgi:hypothetical protein
MLVHCIILLQENELHIQIELYTKYLFYIGYNNVIRHSFYCKFRN